MTASPCQDISLYELACHSPAPPAPLQLSPATLKSVIASLIDVLVDQELVATLWVKLPDAPVWQEEIDRYRTALGEASVLCTFVTEALPATLAEPDPTVARIVLDADSHLKREYFLLAIAANLSVLVLAHQPRSVRLAGEEVTETQLLAIPSVEATLTSQRRHPLLGFITCDPIVIQEILVGLQQAIACSPMPTAPPSSYPDWETFFAQHRPSIPPPNLMSLLLTRQIQRQEAVWRQVVSNRKHAEAVEVLQRQHENAQSEIRLKDELLHMIGQELRTPLTNMKTALTLLEAPNLKLAQRQRYMDLLRTACDRQTALITSVLALLQLEHEATQEPQLLHLSDIVPGVVSTYQPLAQERGIGLFYTIPDTLPTFAGVPSWIRQIVIHLLHNSLKYTPSGGQVWVQASQQGDTLLLEVHDTGIGIPPEEHRHIFEPFYRLRQAQPQPEAEGAGLGLTIVQHLVQRANGAIAVKSQPGGGSTFRVQLPISLSKGS
ncbi:ATP-binding protein [Trichothermofontia sp.]